MRAIIDDGGQGRIEVALLFVLHQLFGAAAGRGGQRRPGGAQQ